MLKLRLGSLVLSSDFKCVITWSKTPTLTQKCLINQRKCHNKCSGFKKIIACHCIQRKKTKFICKKNECLLRAATMATHSLNYVYISVILYTCFVLTPFNTRLVKPGFILYGIPPIFLRMARCKFVNKYALLQPHTLKPRGVKQSVKLNCVGLEEIGSNK